jgi:hypothetical protein
MFRTIMLMPMILGFTTIDVCACLMSVARRQ